MSPRRPGPDSATEGQTPEGHSDEAPSKSALKRESHALQAMAESLLEMNDEQLARIPLPERLVEALRDMREMKKRGALRRQRQYLGRVMREIDAAPIRTALEAIHESERLQNARFHRLETLREEMIEQGDEALEAFFLEYPDVDRQRLRNLVRNAARERAKGNSRAAARNLFRFLRETIEA